MLLATDGETTRIMYQFLRARFAVERVILEDRLPRRELLRKRLKRFGARKVLGQVLFRATIVPWLRVWSRARLHEICSVYRFNDAPIDEGKILRVRSANESETTAALREIQPHVVIVHGTRILNVDVLSCVGAPFVNMHTGITPLYRGVHGGYWALAVEDQANCGVTIHLLDAGVDTGPILAQTAIDVTAEDNFVSYPLLQLGDGLPLLATAVQSLLAGEHRVIEPPPGQSKQWTHPTFGEYIRSRIRRGVA